MDYETLFEIQHNDSGAIQSQPDVSSNNTVCSQLQLCGAGERESGSLTETSCSLWSTPVRYNQGEEGHQGHLCSPLHPSTRNPSSCRHGGLHKNYCSGVYRRQTVRIIRLEFTRSKGRGVSFMVILLRGTNLSLMESWDHTCNFSSKWSEGRKIQPLLTDTIPGRGCQLNDFWAGQDPGRHNVPRWSPGNWRDALSVPPVSNKITRWYWREIMKRQWMREWENDCSCMNTARHLGTKIIPS